MAESLGDRPHVNFGSSEQEQPFLSSLLDAVNELVWCTSLDGSRLHYVNPAAARIYGRPLHELVENQNVWWESIHPEDRPAVERNLRELLSRRQIEQEYRIVRPDGEVRWLRDRITVLCDDNGKPVQVGGIGTDVTERKRAEQALSDSEAVYHSLVENLPLNILRKDLDGRVVFGNQRYCSSLKRSLEDLVGKNDFDLFPKELAEKYVKDDRQVIRTGEVLHEVEEHRTQNGKRIYVEVFKSPVRNVDGEIVGVQVMFWDVTERKDVEAALNHERYLLHTLMENLPDSIYFKDVESRFQRISRALADRFGCDDPQSVIGKCDADFFTEEHAQQARADEVKIMQTGEPVLDLVEKETWPDGRETWAATTKLPLRDSDGKLLGTFGISRDITRQKRAENDLARANRELQAEVAERRKVEEDLARERDLLRTLMDHLPDSISVKDSEGRYVTANAALVKRLGAESILEIVGKTDFDFFPRELAKKYQADDRDVVTTGEPLIDREERTTDAEGNSLWQLTSKVPLCDPEGGAIGLVSIGRDITRRKRDQEQLEAAKEAADAANRAKSDFLANMSHEIRTPMNAVIGMTELLLDTPLDDAQRQYVRMVRESGESLLSLINDILDFSKIEAGKLELDEVPFILQDSLGDTMKSLSLRAHRKSLEVAFHIAPAVPEAVVGDPGRLRQILVNLVGNAIKFTEDGEVVVRVRCVSRTADAVELEFSVTDTGIGIPRKQLQRIFEAFEQADGSTTRRFGGTGLGLAISSRLVELMQGRITVESQVGKGSTFSFTARFGLSEKAIGESSAQLEQMSGMRVLVVDDNATNRRILQDILQVRGMKPILAGNAVEALRELRRAHRSDEPIPLVLTDVNMPEIDGFSLVEQIQRDENLDSVVVIVLTSGDRPGDNQRCKDLGVAARLLKPIKQSELFDAIAGAWGSASSQRETTEGPVATAPKVKPLSILLAEDSQANQVLAVGLLKKWDHSVTVAGDGREAVELAMSQPFDLILMDVQMPELDGLEASREIRRLEAEGGLSTTDRPRIPIVAMTAHALKGDRERCLAAGMDDYISKPIRIPELAATLARVFPDRLVSDNEGLSDEESTVDGSSKGIDWSVALEAVQKDRELLKVVANAFLTEWPEHRDALSNAIAQGDAPTVQRVAHLLKGVMATFGAEPARQIARRLEEMGRTGVLDGADEAEQQLNARLETVVKTLTAFVEQGHGPPEPAARERTH